MNASCLPGRGHRWPDKAVIKPQFIAPLRAKPVSPITVKTMAVNTIRKVSAGHYAFALKTEVQGGVQLSLSATCAKFTADAQARVILSEQLRADGSINFPMYTGATFESNFSLAPGVQLEHHEYSNWRFGEIIFTARPGMSRQDQPLDITLDDFNISAWVAHYRFETARATTFRSSSAALDSVWWLNQNSVKYLGLDMYSDSNARQRSDACQADATTASQAQFAATAELAMPRYQMEMIMDFSHAPDKGAGPNPPGSGGYVSSTWADWTVLPAINVVNDALFTGDLRLAHKYLEPLLEYHLYQHMINDTGTVGAGLVVDNNCSGHPNSCLSCLIDTSGGSDDGFQQSNVNSIVQAWVYYGLTEVAKLARWIGKLDTAAGLDAKAVAMKSAFNRLMISAESGAVCDGLCVGGTNHTSLHASFYALAFGIVDTQHQEPV